MKKSNILLATLISLLLSWPTLAEQENLRQFAEFQIEAKNLLTFSRNGGQIKPCESCPVENISVSSNVELYEYADSISFERATELYVRKNYGLVYIGIDRKTKTAMYFRFGGHGDDQDIEQGAAQ